MEHLWLRLQYFLAISVLVVAVWIGANAMKSEGKVTSRQLEIAGEHLAVAGIGMVGLYALSVLEIFILGYVGVVALTGVIRLRKEEEIE